ncbi:MAG: hypothetical protein QXQ57_00840 [Sulfolobales archaeon]
MVERVEEASEDRGDLWEEVALKIEDRIEKEIEKRLGRKAHYVAAISIRRTSDGIDLGIDLQVFSSSGSREKLLEIVDEVIDAGFREAEKHIKRGWRGDRKSLEGEESGGSISSIS